MTEPESCSSEFYSDLEKSVHGLESRQSYSDCNDEPSVSLITVLINPMTVLLFNWILNGFFFN